MNIEIKTIKYIDKKSPAKKAGLKAEDKIISINNEPIYDFIDESYFNTLERLNITFLRKGKEKTIVIDKSPEEPLGITYCEDLYPPDKKCANACLFCFVDQLPKGMRQSLYVKDDDWRYSVLFGNYVTLTNVKDEELERIVKRQASPLYVSVHASDPETRIKMMLSKKAGRIKEQLEYLTKNKIIMHTQVVLCPGINDGRILEDTIEYLYSLYPYVRTLAVVPVGLTGHRDNLPKLTPVDQDKAREIISTIEKYNKIYQADKQINFVFASDEFYSKAQLPYPVFSGGEHYPQLSNGVGMFSELGAEFEEAIDLYKEDIASINTAKKVIVVTGVSAYDKINEMFIRVKSMAANLNLDVVKIINNHFGETITVAGLLCGTDIAEQLKNMNSDVIIVPASTLKDSKNVFLDDTNIEFLEHKLNAQVLVQDIDGYAMIETILHGTAKG